MTTEREYQEGQDRIRRAQGRSEWLRGRAKGSYPRSYRQPTNRWLPWVIGAIVAVTLFGAIKSQNSRPPQPERTAPDSRLL